jgi:hypothetical protein
VSLTWEQPTSWISEKCTATATIAISRIMMEPYTICTKVNSSKYNIGTWMARQLTLFVYSIIKLNFYNVMQVKFIGSYILFLHIYKFCWLSREGSGISATRTSTLDLPSIDGTISLLLLLYLNEISNNKRWSLYVQRAWQIKQNA